jgi:hypothetical protein
MRYSDGGGGKRGGLVDAESCCVVPDGVIVGHSRWMLGSELLIRIHGARTDVLVQQVASM